MAAQTISPPHTASQGTKRSAEDLDSTPTKRRRHYHHHHAVRYKQPFEADPALHSQDEGLFQSQLDRSLAIALYSAGFDSAKSDAMESLRAATHEFMLHFASRVRKSMLSSRRTQPLPHDFVSALSQNMLTSSDLLPHVSVPIPPSFAMPSIQGPPPSEPAPPQLDPIFGDELNGKTAQSTRRYIPKHFPTLPSKHTWQQTAVFSARETDPRKIRERATQEGVLAEQALRKLAAARRNQTPRRAGALAAAQSKAEARKKQIWEHALASVLSEDQVELRKYEQRQMAEFDAAEGLFEPSQERAAELKNVDVGMVVNSDRRNWRKSASGGAAQA